MAELFILRKYSSEAISVDPDEPDTARASLSFFPPAISFGTSSASGVQSAIRKSAQTETTFSCFQTDTRYVANATTHAKSAVFPYSKKPS